MRRSERQLHDMRARWAERPRPTPKWWLPGKPDWFYESAHLQGLADGEPLLYEIGEVRWARVLMANSVVWEPGTATAPGEVLWSPDPYVEAHPDWLEGPARAYWWLKQPPEVADLKNLRVDIPGWDRLQKFASDEYRSAERRRVPPLLSRRRVVYHDSILFYRSDLPGGVLASSLIPVVNSTSSTPTPTRLLPPRFWAEDLLLEWETEAKSSATAD